MLTYRPEIDGLRTLAILPIVFFHAGYHWVSGGFVGVDIFFVISGYLLGSIIMKETQSGRFSFQNFYERRIRRIVPALLLVLIASLLFGFVMLLPDELTGLAKSTLAAIFFVPNILFWEQASTYFGMDIATEPLLHTWSLGVEEQFYIFLPWLMMGFAKFKSSRSAIVCLLGLMLLSFALNLMMMPVDHKFSFYMLPARAWELLAGVLIAHISVKYQPTNRSGDLMAGLGLVITLGAIFLLDESMPFPGVNAAYPVLGTALIILGTAADRSAIKRGLSLPPIVGIGRISYSLYLWHWPVYVYLSLLYPDGRFNAEIVIASSLIFATLSYRFVEQRYRHTKAQPAPGSLRELLYLTGGILAVCLFALVSAGLPQRISEDAWSKAGKAVQPSEFSTCETLLPDLDHSTSVCKLGDPQVPPSFALWGDSHSHALSLAAHEAAQKKGTSGLLFFGSGCRPLVGTYRPGKTECRVFNDAVLQQLHETPSITTVFLVGYWRVSLTGQGFDTAFHLTQDDESTTLSPAENRQVFRRGLQRTIAALGDKSVVVVEDIPEIGSQFGKAVSNHFVRDAHLNVTRQHAPVYEIREDDFSSDWAALKREFIEAVKFFDLKETLCEGSACPLLHEGKLSYNDGDHLSQSGSTLLTPALIQQLE